MRRALKSDQALDALSAVEQAIAQVRAVIDIAPDVGPVLVASYRALSVLGEVRETVAGTPIVREEPIA